MPPPPRESADAVLPVPEIRDYQEINRELAALLDRGARLVVLAGVEGQRLLVAGLRGDWSASVVLEGHAGPELAAGLDAPALRVVCSGNAADGAGSRLAAGRLRIDGNAADGTGYAQRGGTIVVRGDVGHRAGLMQSGGVLVLGDSVGRLAGERQSGGVLVVREGRVGDHAGRGSCGGRLVRVAEGREWPWDDPDALEAAVRDLG